MKKVLFVLVILSALCFLPHVAASPNAIIQHDSRYIDSAGNLHIFGEVLNNGDVWLQFIKVTGTLKDSNGKVVDVTYTYVSVDNLPPGAKAPFDLFEIDVAKSARVNSYSLVVEYRQATTIPQINLTIPGTASSSIDVLGYLNVVGEVKNSGTATSTFTKVIATFYDQSGKVIYVDYAYTSPTDIPAGQTYGFKITGPPHPVSGRVYNYALFAESHEGTSVPEFPWPVIALLAALSLGFVALPKKRKEKSQIKSD